VPVTSISMPLAALGSAAVDALVARVENAPAGDVMITEPMKMVSRASVAPTPG
jgi:DNA-binding LacI/PurR family transcriptional regulator